MMFVSWDKLPEEMKNDEVRAYYDILRKRRTSLIVKRVFDVTASLIMLILLSWLFLILAVMIKLDSKGPVFFRQTRVTTGNKDFRIFNFPFGRVYHTYDSPFSFVPLATISNLTSPSTAVTFASTSQ